MNWDDLFTDPKNCLPDPTQEVVDFELTMRSRRVRHLLDLGSGAGRHTVYLSRLGYHVVALDISLRGLKITRDRLRTTMSNAELTVGDMRALPFRAKAFDAVICRGVITHNTANGVSASIQEIARTLKSDGLFFCTFISPDSSLFGNGTKIDDCTFVCDDEMERGVVHHFMDQAEVINMVRGLFRIDTLEHVTHGGEINTGRPYKSAHWILTARGL